MTDKIEVLEPEVVAAKLNEVMRSAGLAEDSALELRGRFADYYGEIVEWRGKAAMVTKPDDPTHQKIARDVRLGLRGVRCEVENTRKALKADSLARGKAIDGFANVLKYLCEPIEAALLDVEQYAARKEEARIEELVEMRKQALAATGEDAAAYNLGAMDEKTFDVLLDSAKKRRDDRIEAERKAEADRVAREQADRIAREKAEADAAEARAEADKERSARAASEAKAKNEREKAEAAIRKEREAREKAEADAASARKIEADRIAAEKAAADAKAKAERAAADKAARAPDKAKVMAFAATIRNMKDDLPEGKTAAGKIAFDAIKDKCDAFAAWIERQAESL